MDKTKKTNDFHLNKLNNDIKGVEDKLKKDPSNSFLLMALDLFKKQKEDYLKNRKL